GSRQSRETEPGQYPCRTRVPRVGDHERPRPRVQRSEMLPLLNLNRHFALLFVPLIAPSPPLILCFRPCLSHLLLAASVACGGRACLGHLLWSGNGGSWWRGMP